MKLFYSIQNLRILITEKSLCENSVKCIMGITGCNLCLETITNNSFKLLEGALKDKLQVLIPVINWSNICREPKVCHKCSKTIKKTYGFKIFCLDNNKRFQKLKSAEETLNKNSDSDSDSEEEDEVCCLCRQEDVSEHLEVANVNLKEMVQKCFPQLNIYSSDNQGSCEECLRSLKVLDSFTNSCLESEKYVKNYCSTMDIKRRDRFNFDECIKRKNFPSASNNNEGEPEPTLRETETAADIGTIQQETNRMSSSQEKDLQSDVSNSEGAMKQNKPAESSPKQKKRVKNKKSYPSGKFRCDKCNYSAKAKSALVSHMMKHKDPSKTKMHKCEVCGHETKRKGDLKWHMIVHKNPDEVEMYQCANCQYQTKRKADLKQHVVVHRSRLFKCDFCFFETKNEFYLKTFHLLLHKNKSEINIFKCELCPFETRRKGFMNQHAKTHAEKFKCNWCDFSTVYKNGLVRHLLTHKCRSEQEMFKCYSCNYETGCKGTLKRHMLRHNDTQIIYECEECTFKTKVKKNLKTHVLRHKDQSELKIHECNVCTYKTRTKGNLKGHLIFHIAHLKTLPNKQSEIEVLMTQRKNLSKT